MSRKKNENIRFSEFASNINALIDKEYAGNKKDFSKAINVHYDSVRRWCNGESLPDGANLLLIHEKYNASIDWLLTGKDPGEALISAWAPETQEACRKVKTILESNDKTTAAALHMNINAFEQSIERFDENKKLKGDVEKLKREVNHIKKLNNPGHLTGTG
jgi:transcriptional regulator with XRE-family HTH domain